MVLGLQSINILSRKREAKRICRGEVAVDTVMSLSKPRSCHLGQGEEGHNSSTHDKERAAKKHRAQFLA